MPALLRQSAFGSTWSLLEHRMNFACERVHHDLKLALGVQDLGGEGIHRARTFLEKVGGVSFPEAPHWETLVLYDSIRKTLLHRNGLLEKGDEHSKAMVAQSSALGTYAIDARDHIVLGERFCFEVLDRVEQFLEQLAVSLGERLSR